MQIRELWRYPVKSMRGEKCRSLRIDLHGVVGDRSFGVLDLQSGTIISAKRDGRLLEASARTEGEGVVIEHPAGPERRPGADLDRELTAWLGRGVRLVAAAQHGIGTYECPEDFEVDDSDPVSWQGSAHSFVDESDVHLLTTADWTTLGSMRPDLHWDVRRFRPNIVLDAGDRLSTTLIGQHLRIGDAVLEVTKGCTRCVMTTRVQPGGIERELDILRHVIANCDNQVGVRAAVVRAGSVDQGGTAEVSTPVPDRR